MIFAYALMCLIYGTTFLAIREGDAAGMPPFLFAAIRFTLAGIITLLFLAWRRKTEFPRSAAIYRQLVIIGMSNTALVFAIVYYYEQFVSSGYTALMAATMPFMVIGLERITGKQRITLLQLMGLLLGFIGVLEVAWPGVHGGVPHWLEGTMALLLANVGAALGATQSRRLLATGTVSPFIVNGFQVLFGGIALFVLAGVTGGLSLHHVHALGSGIAALLYLTVFGSIVASGIFYWLVKRTNALLPSTWTYVSPIIAIFVGHWWFAERVYPLTVMGTATVLTGLVLLNLQAFRESWRALSARKAAGIDV